MALVLAAPHLLAGIYAWGTAVLAAMSSVSLGLALWSIRARTVPAADPIAIILAAMLVVTGLHALPMPVEAARVLAPASLQHALATADLVGGEPRAWVAFTQDPAGTWERILFGVAVFATYVSARIVAQQERPTGVLVVVAISTLGVALSYLGHRMVDATQVYGLYTPRFREAFGPILNMNNLAGVLSLGLPLTIGLAVRRDGARRWAWSAAGATIAATGLMAGSRAGLVVLVAGPLLFLGAWLVLRWRAEPQSSGTPRHRHGSTWGVAVLVFALLAVGYGFADLAADNFLDTDYQDLTKFQMFHAEFAALRATAHSLWLGVGRGAFRTALTPVVTDPIRLMYAECFPLQLAIEFGVPLTILFLSVVCWQFARACSSMRSPAQCGGAAGLVAIGLQNLLDFGLELSGVAVPVAACLAAVASSGARDQRVQRANSWVWVLAGACTAAVVGLSYPAATLDIRVAQERLTAASVARERDAFWSGLSSGLRAHPADVSLVGLGAYQRMLEGAPDATRWLNRTMQLGPSLGQPHVWAAYWLSSRGRWQQAEDELRTASELEPKAVLSVLCSWMAAQPRAEFAERVAAAGGRVRRDLLDRAADCLRQTPDEAEKLDDTILREFPEHAPALVRAANRSLARGELERAAQQAKRARIREPRMPEAYEAESTALIRLERPREAVSVLTGARGKTDSNRRILYALALANAHAGEAERMRDTIDLLRVDAGANALNVAQALAQLSLCETVLGNRARALAAIMEAARIHNAPQYQASAANLALELGQIDYTLKLWGELCDAQYGGTSYCVARDRLRSKHSLDDIEP